MRARSRDFLATVGVAAGGFLLRRARRLIGGAAGRRLLLMRRGLAGRGPAVLRSQATTRQCQEASQNENAEANRRIHWQQFSAIAPGAHITIQITTRPHFGDDAPQRMDPCAWQKLTLARTASCAAMTYTQPT